MSLRIEHIILHSLRLNPEGEPVADTRGSELEPLPEVNDLVDTLHRVYQQKGNKSFAVFSDEGMGAGDTVLFPQLLHAFVDGAHSFVSFSISATQLLVEQLKKYKIPEEGVVIFCKYNYVGVDYILLGLLDCEDSITVTDSLDVMNVRYLDIGKMQLMARIDLTEYKTNQSSKRYLSFIKGRAGRKISDFFLDFLMAEETINPLEQNKALIRAVGDYCADETLPSPVEIESRKKIRDYCQEQAKSGQDLELKAISQCLPEKAEGDFYAFVSDAYGLEATFPPSRTALRSLTKYVGSGGGLNISFDAQLLGERVQYDPATDTLVIIGTPPNLRDQLQRKGT